MASFPRIVDCNGYTVILTCQQCFYMEGTVIGDGFEVGHEMGYGSPPNTYYSAQSLSKAELSFHLWTMTLSNQNPKIEA